MPMLVSMTVRLDDYDVSSFARVAAAFGTDRYGFVITPNVDHLIRYCEDASFRELCDAADYVLLDSRFLAHLMYMMKRVRARVCPGSD